MNFKLSRHALEEMERRCIPRRIVEKVLEHPEQVVPERAGKNAYQSKMAFGKGKMFLVRAIVAEDVSPPVVVTVYRTSKIAKYWRTP